MVSSLEKANYFTLVHKLQHQNYIFNFFMGMRRLKNKGAVLVLIWAFLPCDAYISAGIVIKLSIIPLIVISAVSFPILGCLSDVCLGRYKTIRYSLWILWLSLIALNVFLIVKQFAAVEAEVTQWIVECLIGGCAAISICGVMVNTMQFGIDQLTDACSSDICSYISWYVWIVALASNLAAVTQYCFCDPYNQVIGFFILPLLGTAVIVSDLCFNKWLVKEPAVTNPFKIIFQVLRYAMKNKYPRLRSAFTYWEDKPYSRIDLGKAKYGGPFITEQVEDVKTFFRVFGIAVVYSPLAGLAFFMHGTYTQVNVFDYNRDSTLERCNDAIGSLYMSRCYKTVLVQHLPTIAITVFVPILEFILYPMFVKCRYFNNLNILNKLLLGILVLILIELSFIVEKVAIAFTSNEGNSTCFLHDRSNSINSEQLWLDYTKFMFQQPLFGIAGYVLFTSTAEYICAQSPYSMKGLLIGIFFVVQAFSLGLSNGLLKVIEEYVKSDEKCGIWLHTVMAGALIVTTLIHLIATKCYKLRRRDEILDNEQMFAENYLDKCITQRLKSQF